MASASSTQESKPMLSKDAASRPETRYQPGADYTAAEGPPALITSALGGRQFFFENGAKSIHRIGIHRGLGWLLPVGEAKDGINYLRVTTQHDGLLFEFGKTVPAGSDEAPDFELIRDVRGLDYGQLAAVYAENT